MAKPRSCLLLLAGLGLLAGCGIGTGTYYITMHISGGDTVPLELQKGGIVNAENDDFKIEAAVFQYDPKAKRATYLFGFDVKRGAVPVGVKIEDVTDDTPATLFQTDKLKVGKGYWLERTKGFVPDAQNSKWLFEIENSVRVYRFTIVTADGKSQILYEGTNYYPFIKDLVRQSIAGTLPGAANTPATQAAH